MRGALIFNDEAGTVCLILRSEVGSAALPLHVVDTLPLGEAEHSKQRPNNGSVDDRCLIPAATLLGSAKIAETIATPEGSLGEQSKESAEEILEGSYGHRIHLWISYPASASLGISPRDNSSTCATFFPLV